MWSIRCPQAWPRPVPLLRRPPRWPSWSRWSRARTRWPRRPDTAMWRDPGTWIALGISALFIVAGFVMHRVFTKILKQGSPEPDDTETDNPKGAHHEQ